MVAEVPERLSRDMGCTVADLQRWMPGAANGQPIRWQSNGCEIGLGTGQVALAWTPLPPRRIALLRIERLQLDMVFSGCSAAIRSSFLAHFDAYTRRGGG